jgi:hypothetical protein
VLKIPICEVCGKEYEKRIFGLPVIGAPELCPEHSYLWSRYLAEKKKKERTFTAFLASLKL